MKKKATFTIMFFAASLMAGGALAAEERGATDQQQQRSPAVGMDQQQQQQRLVSADDLQEFNVMDAQGEEIGQISQVLIDVESGQVGYAIVGGNGIMGMGEDEFIVPFAALSRGMEEQTLTVDVQKDQLREAPDDVQQISRQQEQEIHQFYGVSPYWEEGGAQQGQQQQDQLQIQPDVQQRDQQLQQERQQQQQPGTGTRY